MIGKDSNNMKYLANSIQKFGENGSRLQKLYLNFNYNLMGDQYNYQENLEYIGQVFRNLKIFKYL